MPLPRRRARGVSPEPKRIPNHFGAPVPGETSLDTALRVAVQAYKEGKLKWVPDALLLGRIRQLEMLSDIPVDTLSRTLVYSVCPGGSPVALRTYKKKSEADDPVATSLGLLSKDAASAVLETFFRYTIARPSAGAEPYSYVGPLSRELLAEFPAKDRVVFAREVAAALDEAELLVRKNVLLYTGSRLRLPRGTLSSRAESLRILARVIGAASYKMHSTLIGRDLARSVKGMDSQLQVVAQAEFIKSHPLLWCRKYLPFAEDILERCGVLRLALSEDGSSLTFPRDAHDFDGSTGMSLVWSFAVDAALDAVQILFERCWNELLRQQAGTRVASLINYERLVYVALANYLAASTELHHLAATEDIVRQLGAYKLPAPYSETWELDIWKGVWSLPRGSISGPYATVAAADTLACEIDRLLSNSGVEQTVVSLVSAAVVVMPLCMRELLSCCMDETGAVDDAHQRHPTNAQRTLWANFVCSLATEYYYTPSTYDGVAGATDEHGTRLPTDASTPGISQGNSPSVNSPDSSERDFVPLSDDQWVNMALPSSLLLLWWLPYARCETYNPSKRIESSIVLGRLRADLTTAGLGKLCVLHSKVHSSPAQRTSPPRLGVPSTVPCSEAECMERFRSVWDALQPATQKRATRTTPAELAAPTSFYSAAQGTYLLVQRAIASGS